MLDVKENKVFIEGILSEIDITEGSYEKNGERVERISGEIKIRVSQKIMSTDNEPTELEIPVSLFANKYTNKERSSGKPKEEWIESAAYLAIRDVKNSYKSIAAVGIENATCVRIFNGQLGMNEYFSRSGQLISFPRISATFVNTVKRDEMVPSATFSTVMYVKDTGYELDRDGVENKNRYKIEGVIPRYGNVVDVIPFVAIAPDAINAVSSFWKPGDTIALRGRLNFSTKVEMTAKLNPNDWGDVDSKPRTTKVSELIITGGNSTPLVDGMGYSTEEIGAALNIRNEKLRADKERALAKNNGSKPSAARPTEGFQTTGFSNPFTSLNI